MRSWDRATHMSKVEWRALCRRSLPRFDDVTRAYSENPPGKARAMMLVMALFLA
jgi:hypothetical protein